MSYNPQADDAKMLKLYGQEVKTSPELPDRKTLLLRARLVLEEALEFVKACGCTAVINERTIGTIHDRIEVVDLGAEPNLIEYADACGDQLVVTYGALNAAGIQVEPVWDEIQRNNMGKAWLHCSVCDAVIAPDGTPRGYHPAAADGSLHTDDWKPVPRFHKREDGKIIKPPYWSPPDIEAVLFRQVLGDLKQLGLEK